MGDVTHLYRRLVGPYEPFFPDTRREAHIQTRSWVRHALRGEQRLDQNPVRGSRDSLVDAVDHQVERPQCTADLDDGQATPDTIGIELRIPRECRPLRRGVGEIVAVRIDDVHDELTVRVQNRRSGCISWYLSPNRYGTASACCPDDGFRYQPTSVFAASSDSSTADSHDERDV